MQLLKRLKNILKYEDIKGLFLYVSLSCVLCLLIMYYPILSIGYIFYLIILFKNNKTIFIYSLVIDIILVILFLIRYIDYCSYYIKDITTGIIAYKKNNYIMVKENLNYIKLYVDDINIYNIGDKITFSFCEYQSKERSLDGLFSYPKYKLYKRIICEGTIDDLISISKSFNIYDLRGLVLNYIDTFSDESKLYIKRLILGYQDFDNSLNESISNLGIIYLYSISGLHINIMNESIKKILNKLNIEEELISMFVSIFFLVFLLISGGSSSISRSILMILINELTSIFKIKVDKIDIISISLIIMLIFNPFLILDTGFYLTFLSTYIIKFSKEKNDLKLTSLITVFTIPILLFNNSKISVFIIFFSLLYNPIFSLIIIPLSYLTFLFKFLDKPYNFIVSLLNKCIEYLNNVNIYLSFSINNIIFVFILYWVLFSLLKYKNKSNINKIILCFINISLLIMFSEYYEIFPKITFLDVGQGDSSLIEYGFNKILIDTGKSDKYNTLNQYLAKNNISRLNYVFISHYDSDHSGALDSLNVRIDYLIDRKNNFEFKTGYLSIKTYYKKYNSENDSSMCLLVKLNKTTIFYSGDIEVDGENNIISKDINNITFLKVSHHGSNTSTSNDFLDKINPKVSIISVGLNNKYNHPSNETLNRLNKHNSIIYRTDYMGTIYIYNHIFFNIIKTYKASEPTIFSYIKYKRIIFS